MPECDCVNVHGAEQILLLGQAALDDLPVVGGHGLQLHARLLIHRPPLVVGREAPVGHRGRLNIKEIVLDPLGPVLVGTFVLPQPVGDIVELVVARGARLVRRRLPTLLYLTAATHVELEHALDNVAHLLLHGILRVGIIFDLLGEGPGELHGVLEHELDHLVVQGSVGPGALLLKGGLLW